MVISLFPLRLHFTPFFSFLLIHSSHVGHHSISAARVQVFRIPNALTSPSLFFHNRHILSTAPFSTRTTSSHLTHIHLAEIPLPNYSTKQRLSAQKPRATKSTLQQAGALYSYPATTPAKRFRACVRMCVGGWILAHAAPAAAGACFVIFLLALVLWVIGQRRGAGQVVRVSMFVY